VNVWLTRRNGMLAIVVLVVISLTIITLLQKIPPKTNPPTTQSSKKIVDTDVQRVFVKDLYKLEDVVNTNTQETIERSLYLNVMATKENQPDLYTGTIRENSYSSIVSGSYRTTKMLVDIKLANITYGVTVTSRVDNPSNVTAYISCAAKSQQISSTAVCTMPEEGL